jgi:ATP-binding cassette subfamily F protein 3
VALAKLTLRGANFLVLDEPTNHLDIPSQEILQEMLSQFAGTILLVTHDRYFVDALATQIWSLEERTLFVSKARSGLRPYAAYLTDRVARQTGEVERQEPSSNGRETDRDEARRRKREETRRQRDMAELEAAIEDAEARLSDLSTALEEASHSQAVEQLQDLSRDYRAIEEELERLLAQWESLEAA